LGPDDPGSELESDFEADESDSDDAPDSEVDGPASLELSSPPRDEELVLMAARRSFLAQPDPL